MRVLFLSPYFFPHIGGVEKHALEVARKLAEKGIDVRVITQKTSFSEKEEININGIKVYRIWPGRDDWFRKFRIWKALWKKRKLISKADLVHAHDVFYWYMPFRVIFPLKKIFVTFHGFEGKFPVSKKAIMVRRISEELSFGNICVGDYIKKWYGTKPSLVTYGGVEISKTKRNKIKKINKKLRILFIGRLDPDTGISIYLKALQALKENGVDYELNVCGDGILKKQIGKLGKLNGFVKDLNSYLANADVVLTSSYLSILESILMGKPVFSAFDNPLKKDYLEMAPFSKFIVIESNPDKMALKIQNYSRIANNKLAVEWAKKQTWDKLANSYLKLFK